MNGRSQLETTRIGMAEHCYPTPTRRILAMHNSEARKANPISNGSRTIATKVKTMRIMPDGTRRYVEYVGKRTYSDAENAAFDRAERKRRLAAIVAGQAAEVDTWASHA